MDEDEAIQRLVGVFYRLIEEIRQESELDDEIQQLVGLVEGVAFAGLRLRAAATTLSAGYLQLALNSTPKHRLLRAETAWAAVARLANNIQQRVISAPLLISQATPLWEGNQLAISQAFGDLRAGLLSQSAPRKRVSTSILRRVGGAKP